MTLFQELVSVIVRVGLFVHYLVCYDIFTQVCYDIFTPHSGSTNLSSAPRIAVNHKWGGLDADLEADRFVISSISAEAFAPLPLRSAEQECS